MQRTVFQAGFSQQLFDSKDTVSGIYGNKDGLSYCGPRLIELTTSPTVYQGFLSFDPTSKMLILASNNPADAGLYTIGAKISLAKYPAILSTTTFKVQINYCAVTDMQQQPVPEQFYNVYTPSLAFAALLFTITPSCGYTLEY